MHEYSHAGNRADILRKLRRLFPVKTKLSNNDYMLIHNYLEEAYATGGRRSQEMGRNIQDLVAKALNMKERDTWRFLEEIRANAQAYTDTKNITNGHNAYKVLQPLSAGDAGYSNLFNDWVMKSGVKT
jgi:CheY-like chemotaxis protein